MTYRKIGIIGAGTIGRSVFDYLKTVDTVDVAYVMDLDPRAAERHPDMASALTSDIERALNMDVDLVVEAATPSVLAGYGARILARADLCGFSCSALSKASVEEAIYEAARSQGHRFFLPHGAILGLDGLCDGRDQLETVVVTTTKSGSSLGMDPMASGLVFEGSTREACERFPRNVNVHAAVALSGIGFDRTRSIVVADPATQKMQHTIEVSGPGLVWEIAVSSTSLGGVTGSYTPSSAVGSVRRILGTSALQPV